MLKQISELSRTVPTARSAKQSESMCFREAGDYGLEIFGEAGKRVEWMIR